MTEEIQNQENIKTNLIVKNVCPAECLHVLLLATQRKESNVIYCIFKINTPNKTSNNIKGKKS